MSFNIEFDSSGFDDFQKKLEKKIKEAEGNVPLEELLNDKFIKKHTRHKNLDDFIDASEVDFSDPNKAIESKEWDIYVKGNSSFSGWEDMISKAGQLYMKNKLELE